jgi:hypothetical protein
MGAPRPVNRIRESELNIPYGVRSRGINAQGDWRASLVRGFRTGC